MDLPEQHHVFEGRYELTEVLGRGGFATVYRARDNAVGRDVVVKILSPKDGSYGQVIAARFQREARVFAELQDPHNITMYDFGTSEDGLLYMVFEYVAGRDLAQLLAERGPLDPAIVVRVVEQLLYALREAHERGVLHRDIKPANVLVYERDEDPYRVKLLDFGIAKETTPAAEQLTRTGMVVGTVRYMSPEQLVGHGLGPSSDLYSLGLVAAEMLTGKPVIEGENQGELLRAQMSETPLRVEGPNVPPALAQIVERMLAREPHQRYQSAQEVLTALAAARRRAAEASVSGPFTTPRLDASTTEPDGRPDAAGSSVFGPALLVLGVIVGGATTFVLVRSATPPRPVDEPRSLTLPPTPPQPVLAVAQPPARAPDVGPATPDAAAHDGCGRQPPFTGHARISGGALSRGWPAYIPASYNPHRRHPIVLMFHRGFWTADRLLVDSRMPAIAEREGLVLVGFEAPGVGTGYPTTETVGEVVQALAIANDQLCVDPTRRYAIGDEHGGTFVGRLPCAVPLSAYAALWDVQSRSCKPLAKTARLRIYGKLDKHIPVAGGHGCTFLYGDVPSATGIEKRWKERYECSKSSPWGDFPGGRCHVWECDVAPLLTCETDGGHQWPGNESLLPSAACDTPPPAVDFPFAEAIWQAFDQHGTLLDEVP